MGEAGAWITQSRTAFLKKNLFIVALGVRPHWIGSRPVGELGETFGLIYDR